MRSTAISAVFLVAAVLLAAPAAATRALNQDTNVADPNKKPTSDVTVGVTVILQPASCPDVLKKATTSISSSLTRAVHQAASGPVRIIEDPATCTDGQGVAIVTVTAKVTFVSPGNPAAPGQIKKAFGPITDLPQLADKDNDFKNLMNWARVRGIQVTDFNVVVNP